MRKAFAVCADSGASAVEFALVLLLLVLLLFGIIQYGYAFFEYIQVAHAASEGVRWGALGFTDAEIRAKAASASPGLGTSMTVSIERTGAEYLAVTVTYPVTQLAPLPSIAVPESVSSTAVQRIE